MSYRFETIPNYEERISIHVKCLYSCIIILDDDFYESLVCTIDNRSVHDWWPVQWLARKIKLVISLHLVYVSKAYRGIWINKRDSIVCGSQFPIDGHWGNTLENVHISYINRAIVERALWIGTSSTSRYILPEIARKYNLVKM